MGTNLGKESVLIAFDLVVLVSAPGVNFFLVLNTGNFLVQNQFLRLTYIGVNNQLC